MPDPTADAQPSAPPGLRVAASPGRGRGLFAARAFAVGEVIARTPVVVFPRTDGASLRGTLLDDYWFWWDDAHNAMALGCAALCNHACPSNAAFARDLPHRLLVLTAVRPIAAGDEITINYHGDPDDASPVWFEAGAP